MSADKILYWEDFKVGEAVAMGSHKFAEDEMIDFARKFDPQPFHVDTVAARSSHFGGLIASGWHTCAVAMRLLCENYINRSASLGSPGIENVRWLKPVYAGDTISYRRVILEARPSNSRRDMGLVKSRTEAVNQKGETVMTFDGWGMFGRRPG